MSLKRLHYARENCGEKASTTDIITMKVLYITHCTDMSGANRSMIQMITELRDNHGVDPFVVYPKEYYKSGKSIEQVLMEKGIPGMTHKLTCFQRGNVNLLHKVYFIVFETIYLLHLLFLLRKRKFDIVHSNSSVLDIGLYLAKCMHIPHVWHFREVAVLSFGSKSVLGEKYQKRIYNNSDRIIAISNNVKEEFKDLIPLNKTIVVYNGILPPKVTCLPDYERDKINICIIGRVETNKNQMEAVKAIELLEPEIRKRIILHVIGDNKGDYGQYLVKYVKDKHLEDICIIHGVRIDVNEMLQDMNIGLMLSKHEAFGRVTVEYMMHYVCVIASNTSANPEIIHDGENGVLYDFGSPEQLASKIELLVTDRKLMKHLAGKGYDDAMREYLSVANSNKIYDVYQELV